MAGVPNGQVNIQDIVRAVVDNFNRLPPRSSPNPTGTASASTTTNEELNRCFQIPRGSQSFRPPCRAESQPNSQTAACTTTDTNDLSRRPQTLQSCQPQVTSQPTLSCSLSSGFSARTNYGATTLNSARATSRRRPRSANRSSNTGRFQPYSSSSSQVSAEPEVYYKAVCLLPSPTWNTVPRGKVKVDLIEKNLCVDAWAVDKSWSAEDLKSEAAKLFPKVLGIDSPELIP